MHRGRRRVFCFIRHERVTRNTFARLGTSIRHKCAFGHHQRCIISYTKVASHQPDRMTPADFLSLFSSCFLSLALAPHISYSCACLSRNNPHVKASRANRPHTQKKILVSCSIIIAVHFIAVKRNNKEFNFILLFYSCLLFRFISYQMHVGNELHFLKSKRVHTCKVVNAQFYQFSLTTL